MPQRGPTNYIRDSLSGGVDWGVVWAFPTSNDVESETWHDGKERGFALFQNISRPNFASLRAPQKYPVRNRGLTVAGTTFPSDFLSSDFLGCTFWRPKPEAQALESQYSWSSFPKNKH